MVCCGSISPLLPLICILVNSIKPKLRALPQLCAQTLPATFPVQDRRPRKSMQHAKSSLWSESDRVGMELSVLQRLFITASRMNDPNINFACHTSNINEPMPTKLNKYPQLKRTNGS